MRCFLVKWLTTSPVSHVLFFLFRIFMHPQKSAVETSILLLMQMVKSDASHVLDVMKDMDWSQNVAALFKAQLKTFPVNDALMEHFPTNTTLGHVISVRFVMNTRLWYRTAIARQTQIAVKLATVAIILLGIYRSPVTNAPIVVMMKKMKNNLNVSGKVLKRVINIAVIELIRTVLQICPQTFLHHPAVMEKSNWT